jgi:hypothetical protein
VAEILEVVVETPSARSLVRRAPGWPGHAPGQRHLLMLELETSWF